MMGAKAPASIPTRFASAADIRDGAWTTTRRPRIRDSGTRGLAEQTADDPRGVRADRPRHPGWARRTNDDSRPTARNSLTPKETYAEILADSCVRLSARSRAIGALAITDLAWTSGRTLAGARAATRRLSRDLRDRRGPSATHSARERGRVGRRVIMEPSARHRV